MHSPILPPTWHAAWVHQAPSLLSQATSTTTSKSQETKIQEDLTQPGDCLWDTPQHLPLRSPLQPSGLPLHSNHIDLLQTPAAPGPEEKRNRSGVLGPRTPPGQTVLPTLVTSHSIPPGKRLHTDTAFVLWHPASAITSIPRAAHAGQGQKDKAHLPPQRHQGHTARILTPVKSLQEEHRELPLGWDPLHLGMREGSLQAQGLTPLGLHHSPPSSQR